MGAGTGRRAGWTRQQYSPAHAKTKTEYKQCQAGLWHLPQGKSPARLQHLLACLWAGLLSYTAAPVNVHKSRWDAGWARLGRSTCQHMHVLGADMVGIIRSCANQAVAPAGLRTRSVMGWLGWDMTPVGLREIWGWSRMELTRQLYPLVCILDSAGDRTNLTLH